MSSPPAPATHHRPSQVAVPRHLQRGWKPQSLKASLLAVTEPECSWVFLIPRHVEGPGSVTVFVLAFEGHFIISLTPQSFGKECSPTQTQHGRLPYLVTDRLIQCFLTLECLSRATRCSPLNSLAILRAPFIHSFKRYVSALMMPGAVVGLHMQQTRKMCPPVAYKWGERQEAK